MKETRKRTWRKLKSAIAEAVFGFIPAHVRPGVLLWFFERLRGLQKLVRKKFGNAVRNAERFLAHTDRVAGFGGFIEDQAAYGDMRFGKSTVRHSGCEVIAAYNALRSLEKDGEPSLPLLIDAFERDGMVLSGRWGTAPKAIRDFFVRQGYWTSFTAKEKEFDGLGGLCDDFILTIYNDRHDIRRQVHTVYISKRDGEFAVHNLHGNGSAPRAYRSLSGLVASINGGSSKPISLLGIRHVAPMNGTAPGQVRWSPERTGFAGGKGKF